MIMAWQPVPEMGAETLKGCCADLYGSRALFRDLWPRLLDAAVVEAISEFTQPPERSPTAEAVENAKLGGADLHGAVLAFTDLRGVTCAAPSPDELEEIQELIEETVPFGLGRSGAMACLALAAQTRGAAALADSAIQGPIIYGTEWPFGGEPPGASSRYEDLVDDFVRLACEGKGEWVRLSWIMRATDTSFEHLSDKDVRERSLLAQGLVSAADRGEFDLPDKWRDTLEKIIARDAASASGPDEGAPGE